MNENKIEESHEFLSRKGDSLEIDLVKFISQIWGIRRKILKFVVVGAILGLIISFSIPKQYSVVVTLAPETTNDRSSGGGFAHMAASLLGRNVPSRDAVNAMLAPEIIQSTPFILEMLDLPLVSEELGVNTTLSSYLENEKTSWWKLIMSLPGKAVGGILSLFKSEKEIDDEALSANDLKNVVVLDGDKAGKIYSLKSKISAEVDENSFMISLKVSLQDPVLAAITADSMVSKLQNFIISYKISKAKEDYDYWQSLFKINQEQYFSAQRRYANYIDSHNNIILQSEIVERERLQNEMSIAYQTYSQVAQQLQIALAKIQEAKPVFTIIEPAVVPLQASTMSRFSMMFIFAFLGAVVAVGIDIIKVFYKKIMS